PWVAAWSAPRSGARRQGINWSSGPAEPRVFHEKAAFEAAFSLPACLDHGDRLAVQQALQAGERGAAGGDLLLAGAFLAAAFPVQVVLGQLLEETRRLAIEVLAVAAALLGVADCQLALRAGDADVHQAALFLDGVRLDAVPVRQDLLLDADEVHVRKLQSDRKSVV